MLYKCDTMISESRLLCLFNRVAEFVTCVIISKQRKVHVCNSNTLTYRIIFVNAYVSLCIFTSAMLYNGGVCCRKVSIHPSAIMSCSVTQSVTQAYCFLSSQKKYAVKQFLGGLNSGTTARSTGDLAESVYVQQVVRKRFPEQVCPEEATKCVVNDSADVTYSGSAGRLPENSATNSRQSAGRHY